MRSLYGVHASCNILHTYNMQSKCKYMQIDTIYMHAACVLQRVHEQHGHVQQRQGRQPRSAFVSSRHHHECKHQHSIICQKQSVPPSPGQPRASQAAATCRDTSAPPHAAGCYAACTIPRTDVDPGKDPLTDKSCTQQQADKAPPGPSSQPLLRAGGGGALRGRRLCSIY